MSRIILGCMSYGDPRWSAWVLPEEEAVKHIKFAYVYVLAAQTWRCSMGSSRVACLLIAVCRYDHGITTFDTANVSPP